MSTAPNPIPAPLLSDLRPAFGWSIALAVLLIVAGFFAILIPFVSSLALTLVIGWAFTVAGILHFFFAWKIHSTSGVLWEILLGILYLMAGFYLFFRPIAGLVTLTLMLAAYFLIKAILELVQFFQIQPRHGSGWLLFDGIVSLALAFMIWKTWPSSSVWALGTLVGIGMIFSGFSRLMLTLMARRVVHG
jgi:uncharacterized membrane protein HdeD (DUF308 family)